MIDSNSIPIAIKSGPDRYIIALQLREPGMDSWHAVSALPALSLEVSKLGEQDWTPLGIVHPGISFKVPPQFGPVPLFRTHIDGKTFYIGVRKIELEGTSNFRDIGGYVSQDGSSQVQFGKIFRSDNLANLSSADWAVLEELGISHIVDLRRSDEKARRRTTPPRHSQIEIIEIPIEVEVLGKSELIEHIFSKEITRITNDDMAQMYEDLISKSRTELSKAVSILLDPARKNAIVHCTAGKDRTGLSVALIHLLCDVSRDQIMSDFLLSNSFRTPARIAALSEKLKSHQVDIEDIVPYLSASKQALQRAFEILDTQFSGADDYLSFDETASATPPNNWKSHLIYP